MPAGDGAGTILSSSFDPDQLWLEPALRGRAARRARALVRRSLPTFVRTPRWSDADAFLEELALDLAVGEPAVGCRRVALRYLRGAGAPRARLEVLRLLSQLARPRSLTPPPVPADRRGFKLAIVELVVEAHERALHRTALLFSEVEQLPVEVGRDLVEAWLEAMAVLAPRPEVALLLAGSSAVSWAVPFTTLDLADLGEGEAAVAITRRAGRLDADRLEQVTRLSGGVPALVDDLARLATDGRLARDVEAALGTLRVADEVRGVLDIAGMDPQLGARLAALGDGPRVREDEDARLVAAGLARVTRDGRHTELRAPAFAHWM